MLAMETRYDCQFVYALRYPDTKQCFYVGRTGNIHRRIQDHAAVRRFWPTVEILEYYGLHNDNVAEAESYWIREMRSRGEPLENKVDKSPSPYWRLPT